MQLRKQFAMPEGDIVTMYRIFEDFNSTYKKGGTLRRHTRCN